MNIKKLSTYFNTKLMVASSSFILVLVIFSYVGNTLMPFLISLLIAYLSNPLVHKLMKYGISRTWAAVIVFAFIFLGVGTIVILSIPIIQNQISTLISTIPQIYDALLLKLNWLINYLGLQNTVNKDEMKKLVADNFSQPGGLALWIWHATLDSSKALMNGVIDIILIPFLTYYLIRDWDVITEKTQNLIPSHNKHNIKKLLLECQKNLSGFLRGQLLVVLCMSVFYSITFTISGLKVGIVMGIIMGLLTFFPYIGSIIGLVIASVVALAQTSELTPLLGVVISYAFGHLIENFYLDPKLIGNKIGLHPVLVILVILLAGSMFGSWGILLALPATSVGIVLIKHVQENQKTLNTF